MPRTQLCRKHWIHGQRQKAGRRRNPIFLYDDGTVVQRRTGTKNGGQQIVGQLRVQRNSAFDIGTQSDFALNHDEGAGLVLRKKIGRQNDVVIGVAFREEEPPRTRSAAVLNRRARDGFQIEKSR